jgi:hypothetical protein
MVFGQSQARRNGSFSGRYNFNVGEQEVCLDAASAIARERMF